MPSLRLVNEEEEEEVIADGGSESNLESGSDSGSGSDSDSDLGSPSDYQLQPVSGKRTYEETPSPSAKKSKTAAGSSTPSLWSGEDETALLNGIIDYKESTGLCFNADLGAFCKFMEGKLQIDVEEDQLAVKINSVKASFFDAVKKGVDGEDPLFLLSKKIWGDSIAAEEDDEDEDDEEEDVEEDEEVVDDDDDEVEDEDDEEDDEVDEEAAFKEKYPFLSGSFSNLDTSAPSMDLSESGVSYALKRIRLMGDARAKELDDKWKDLIYNEIELYYKKIVLMRKQLKAAYNLSD